jgi:hypothetical protein
MSVSQRPRSNPRSNCLTLSSSMRFAAQMAMNAPPATRPTSRLMMTGVAIYLPLLCCDRRL